MRHFYKFLLPVIVFLTTALPTLAIPGYDITIKVDDPSRVKVEFAKWGTVQSTVDFAGATQITMEWPYDLQMKITATDGNYLTNVTIAGEEQYLTAGLSTTISFDRSNYEDETVQISSAALNRSVNFTVKTDVPEKLMMFNSTTYKAPNRIDGFEQEETVLQLDPDFEYPICFNGSRWNDNILKAYYNGTDITNPSGSYYELNPADGDVVQFYFNLPQEVNYNVGFNYLNGCRGIVTSVKVDGVVKEDFDGSDFQVPAGAKLQIYIDTDNYEINSISCNGEQCRWTNKEIYLDAVRNDLSYTFDAVKFGLVTVYINVDNAEGVQVFNSSYNNHTPLALSNGLNEVEVDQNYSQYICIISHPDYRLLSVDINDAPMDRAYINYYRYQAGDRIDISTERLERDGNMYLYIDRPNNIYMFRANESLLTLEPGFNLVPISVYDSPFTIYHPAYATINDVRLYNEAEDDYIYYAEIQDGDIVKLHLDDNPQTHTLTFESADASAFKIIKDFTREVPVSASQAHHGSRFTLIPNDNYTLTVTANSVDIPLTESLGLTGHHIDLTADTSVSVNAVEVGINPIAISGDNTCDVYAPDGTLIKASATASDIDSLPRGVYIAGGKKIVK